MSDEPSLSVDNLSRAIFGILGVFGAVVSVVTAVSYLFKFAFLLQFRAGWLVSQVSLVDALLPTGAVIIIVGGVFVAFVRDFESWPFAAKYPDNLTLALGFAAAALGIAAPVSTRFSSATSSLLYLFAAMFAVALGIACANLARGKKGAIDRLSIDRFFAATVALVSLSASVYLAGAAYGSFVRAHADRWLPNAVFQQRAAMRRLPALLIGQERAYCVDAPDHRTIVVVPINDIVQISGAKRLDLFAR